MNHRMLVVLSVGLVGLLVLGLSDSRKEKQQPPAQGQIVHIGAVEVQAVSHNPRIKKQVILSEHAVPHLIFLSRSVFKTGDSAPGHSHADMHEVFHVAAGTGTFTINGVNRTLQAGDTAHLAPFETHEVSNNGPEDLVLVYFAIRP
ncbi:hypothetical protein DIPPA_35510 [Diplonema papillatum]|nr:hypothetical protein DIPPA_35510 [Diplonema papillatum]